jgi:hypothetical protein
MASADNLSLIQTILTGISLLAIILATASLIGERIRRVHESDERYQTTKASRMGCFSTERLGILRHFWDNKRLSGRYLVLKFF